MDAQGDNQDALPEGGQPSGKTTPEPSIPRTFTEEEVNKLVAQRHSKLDKTIAEQKELIDSLSGQRDELAQAQESLAAELEEVQARIEDAEFSKVKGDPALSKLYLDEKAIKKAQMELDRKEQIITQKDLALNAFAEELKKASVGAKMAETAVNHGISVADLEQELEDLGISDPGRFDKVAERLATRKGSRSAEIVTDSGLSVGSRGEPTPEQLEKMSMAEYKAYRDKQKQKGR